MVCFIVPLIWTRINTFLETFLVKLTLCNDEVFRQMMFVYFSQFLFKKALIVSFFMTLDYEDD